MDSTELAARIILFAPVLVTFAAGVGYLVTTRQLLALMKLKHAETWEQLGRPEVERFSPRSTHLFLRYMWSRRADSVTDGDFPRLRRHWRLLAVAFAVSMMSLVIVIWSAWYFSA